MCCPVLHTGSLLRGLQQVHPYAVYPGPQSIATEFSLLGGRSVQQIAYLQQARKSGDTCPRSCLRNQQLEQTKLQLAIHRYRIPLLLCRDSVSRVDELQGPLRVDFLSRTLPSTQRTAAVETLLNNLTECARRLQSLDYCRCLQVKQCRPCAQGYSAVYWWRK